MGRTKVNTTGPDRWLSCAYSLVSPVYDFFWARDEMRRDLADRLRLEPGQRVLETGVGTGANLPFLSADVGPFGEVEGVDISAAMLRRAERVTASIPCPARLALHNASKLPYPDGSFDAVLHFGGINLFTDREKALLEMVRVARAGARLIIADETVNLRGRWGGIISSRILDLFTRLRPPLDLIPPQARVMDLGYSPRGFFYILELLKESPNP